MPRHHIEVDGLERDMRLQLNASPANILGAYFHNLQLDDSLLKNTNTNILIPTIVHVLYTERAGEPESVKFKPTEEELNFIMNELQLLMNNNNMNIHFNVSYNYVNLTNHAYGAQPLRPPMMGQDVYSGDDVMDLNDAKDIALNSIPAGNREYYLHIYLVNSIKGYDSQGQVSNAAAPIHSYNPIVSEGDPHYGLSVSMWSLPSLSYLYPEENLNYAPVGMNHFFRGIGHVLGLLNIPTVHASITTGGANGIIEYSSVRLCPNSVACLFNYAGSDEMLEYQTTVNTTAWTEGDCCNDTGSISLEEALVNNGGYLSANSCDNNYLILDNIMHFYPVYGYASSISCKITLDQRSRIRSHFDLTKFNGQPTILTKIGIPVTSNVIDLQCATSGNLLTATDVQESIDNAQSALLTADNLESERMLQAQIAYLYSIINNSTL